MSAIASSCLYVTGFTQDGKPLIGGIWTLWHQDGFPLEMSHLVCQGNGWAVDWAEAMIDASTSHNCPALMGHIEAFLPRETLESLKLGFMRLIHSGKSSDELLAEKKQNAANLGALVIAARDAAKGAA